MSTLELPRDQLEKLPLSIVGTYLCWQRGMDLHRLFSKSTFYRHRKVLLTYDIDISISHPNPERETAAPLQRIIEAVPIDALDCARGRGLVD